jgi:beta-glucanase (GH16 family)
MNHFSSGRILAFALTAFFVVSACEDSKRPVPYSQVEIGDPPVVVPPVDPEIPPQSNVNIDDPTLTVANNEEVSPGDTLTLVWSDEFDGDALDPEIWFFETGDGSEYGIPGWGNNELQYYLPDNAQLDGGLLKIEVREESIGTFNYTSARIDSYERFAFKYGRIEARMRLPGGQGIWPAFWMLPQDYAYGGWAASGEIDIMEAVNLGGTGGNMVLGTLHYGGESPNNVSTGESYVVPTDAKADFHTYALEWDATEIRWYVDDVMYAMQNSWSSTGEPFPAPFDKPFNILFNVAVGGNLPGSPDESTVFPVTMEVDWVRVYSGEAPSGGGDEPTAAAPTPTADEANVISLFSDAYTDIAGINYNPDWGQATVVTQEDVAGNNTLKYANLNYQGTDFAGNPQDVSGMDTVHVDFWTADSTALNVSLISSGPAEAAYALTVMPNTWVSVDIPLTEFAGVDLTDVIQIKFDGNGTVWLDNLYFETAGGSATEPTVAAPTPTADPADVISLFSDAYTDIAGINYNPDWGQATVVTQEDIAGNNTLKYAGLNYQGTDFAGNAQDVSGMDTLHVDFWTADSTALNVSLISSGPVETAYALTITPNTWVSVDIPLTAFAGVDLADVIQLKFDGNGTIWLDNLYFESSGPPPTEPVAAAPTPTADAADVISLFSDAYTDIAGINYNPDWGQATVVTQVDIAGNNTLKYAGLNYQGTDFAGNAQDVSGMDTLHVDFWTADSTALNVSLISTGPVEMAYALTITPYTWVSVDIPLTAFTGVDLADVIQLKFDGNGTIWLDNLYFATTGGGTGGELAVNGDLETGDLTGWTVFDNGGTVALSSPGAAGSNYAINADASGMPVGVTIKQANVGAGSLTAGQTVTVSFDWKGTDASGGVVDVVLFSELSGGGVSQTDPILGGAGFPADWTTVGPLNITVGPDVSGGITLQMTAICGGAAGCTSNIFFDNVSITVP